MKKEQKKWLIIAIIIVVLILIIILGSKKESVPGEEEYLPEGFDKESLKDMESAPEIKVGKSEPIEVAPGASKVDSEGKVVNVIDEEFVPVKTEGVHRTSEDAPQQSESLDEETKKKVAENAIEINVSKDAGFIPSSFKVKPGQVVTILLTGGDNRKHEFRFRDASLSSITIVARKDESRALTFNAPTQPGVYEFFCPYPAHNNTGQMIVTEE